MLVHPDQHSRPPVTVRWTRDGILRAFLAVSVMGWALALNEVSLLSHTEPVWEDGGLSHAVWSRSVELWWVPVLGSSATALLLLPAAAAKWLVARVVAALQAGLLAVAAIGLLAWIAPVQAYREGTFYDYPSWGSVSLTALIFIAPGVIALAAAVILLSRSALLSPRLRLSLLGASAAAGMAALVALSLLGAFLEADQGHRGFGTIAQRTLVALAGIALIVMLVRPGRRPAWLRGMVVMGSLLAVAAIVVAAPGLAAGAICVFGSGVITEWVCGPAVIVLAAAEITFLVGWVLYARAQTRLDPKA